MVKGRKSEAPIFSKSDAGNTLLSCKPLKGLDVNSEVVCCLFCCQ